VSEPLRVLIASPLEAGHVERIAAVDRRLEVLYEPELLPLTRYVADHHGPHRDLSEAQLDRWRGLLASADITFDFDWWQPAAMPTNCPNLRWVQATSSGIGQFVQRTGLDQTGIVFTTAAGVHAIPLAEFALAGVLHFVKGFPTLAEWQAARRWERYTTHQLAGQRILVVGLGHVGRQVATTFASLGVHVYGVARSEGNAPPESPAEVVGPASMDALLPEMDAIVLCCPLTPETEGLLDQRRIRLLRPGAIVVNIARGGVVDEGALTEALADGHLGGACLDVAAVEPLPPSSPLWGMSNVIISPHSASTVDDENAIITDIFCENLQNWMDEKPLKNRYSADKGY
jgi:glyoxylate/hydroxypyruvate reductase